MPELRIVLDAEQRGLGIGPDKGRTVVSLPDNTEVVIGCREAGTASGKPTVMMAFKLPSGDLVVFETTWKLFGSAYHSLVGKLGVPEFEGMRLIHSQPDQPTQVLDLVKSEEPFVQCGHCKWRLEGANTEESVEHLVRQYQLHYRKKHRGIPPPPPFPEMN